MSDTPQAPGSRIASTRRALLKTTGVGLLSTSGMARAAAATTTSSGDEIWHFTTGYYVFSSPTVVDDTVFVGSRDNKLYALDAADGTEQWHFTTGADVYSSPTVVDGTVFVGSDDNKVYALDASDGTEQWRFTTEADVTSSPTVVGGTVFVGSNDNNVYALDAADGTEQWRFTTEDWVYSSPTVVDGTVFVGSVDNKVYALDASDGTEQWHFTTEDRVFSSPTVADGTVFVGSYDNKVYALDASDGTEQWHFTTEDFVWSSLTVVDGTVFAGCGDNKVYALDASDGTEQWHFTTEGRVYSSPTAVDGTVFVGSDDNKVYALDASDGTEQWRFTTEDWVRSSPTVVDGTVFVGSFDNKLYAIDGGVSGSSEGSRVTLGTLGHHFVWAGTDGPDGGAVFEISAQATTGTVAPGETTTIYPVVTNTGDAAGDGAAYFQAATESTDHNADYYDETFSVVGHDDDGGRWEYEGWSWTDIPPSERREPSVTLEIAESVEPGDYTFALEAIANDDFESPDDTATATVTVEEDDSSGVSLQLSGENKTAAPGDTVTVTYTVENTGDADEASLLVEPTTTPSGVSVEAVAAPEALTVEDQTALFTDLGAGSSYAVSVTYRLATDLEAGTYTLEARTEGDSGATDTATTTLDVAQVDGVVARYDDDGSGTIDSTELLDALADYPDTVSDTDLLELLSVYEK